MDKFIIIGICIFLNALLAAYEIAFVSAPLPELRRLARTGNTGAQRILALRTYPERALSIIQIGITLVGVLSASVAGIGAAKDLSPFFIQTFHMREILAEVISILLVTLPITYLNVVLGELVPKTLALRSPVKIALRGASGIVFLDKVLTPVVTALVWSTKWLLKLFPQSKSKATPPETTIDIDNLSQHHQQAVLNLAHLERQKIQDILLPWKNVTFVRSSDSMEDVVPVVFASGHTRLPVIDNGNVIGILHTKEFLALRETGARDWRPIIGPIIRVRPTDSPLNVFRLMQAKRNHMAVVLSPTGDRLGIVTLEDVSEEIWGEIYDEDENSRMRRIFSERVKLKMSARR